MPRHHSLNQLQFQLQILASVCTCTANVAKVLHLLDGSHGSQPNGRFQFVSNVLYSLDETKLGDCLAVTLDLVNRILTNVTLSERLRIQYELEDLGLGVQTLQLVCN